MVSYQKCRCKILLLYIVTLEALYKAYITSHDSGNEFSSGPSLELIFVIHFKRQLHCQFYLFSILSACLIRLRLTTKQQYLLKDLVCESKDNIAPITSFNVHPYLKKKFFLISIFTILRLYSD